LAQGDEVRQIITRITRQRPSEILHILQNDFCNTIPRIADMRRLRGHVGFGPKSEVNRACVFKPGI
jgi:hypothetical protein